MRLASRVGLLACLALAAPARVHAPPAAVPGGMRGATRPASVPADGGEIPDDAPAAMKAGPGASGGVMSSDAALLIGWTGESSR